MMYVSCIKNIQNQDFGLSGNMSHICNKEACDSVIYFKKNVNTLNKRQHLEVFNNF